MTSEPKPEDVEALIGKIAVATAAATEQEASSVPANSVELTNKVADMLFNSVNRKLLGILTKQQVSGVKKILLLNDVIYDNKPSILTRLVNNEIDLSVSEGGEGRKQLVTLTRVEDPVEQNVSRIKRFIG